MAPASCRIVVFDDDNFTLGKGTLGEAGGKEPRSKGFREIPLPRYDNQINADFYPT